MKVFVAGATGAIGRPLLPQLLAAGHEVSALTRSPEKAEDLLKAGVEPVVADALDRDAIVAAIVRAKPDVVVHELTAIDDLGDLRHFDRGFATTNRLRTEGTDNLLAGARAAGARRFVAQSFGGWPYAREGGMVKSESDPLDERPPSSISQTLAAIKHLERTVVTAADGIEGLVLRYGGFYGPGTSIDADDGQTTQMVKKRRFPIVGDGNGVWSLVHVEDAAAATVAAVERGEPGIYNVTDDEPAPVREWLPFFAETIGAKPPRRVPTWLGRLAAGELAVTMMTAIRGASNAKAKRELGWTPRYPSWREGFRTGLG
jgi:2-alkyl-3-oxoalkanoate reductase